MSEFSEAPTYIASATPQERVYAHKTPAAVPKQTTSPNPEAGESNSKIDLLIVFGQGPVKPLLRDSELDPQMKEKWEAFKADPLHNTEPDFRVLEGDPETNVYLSQLKGLNEAAIDAKMAQWQNLGRFGLNRWGRQNALATGFALVSGYSERALLSGGKTMPGWAKDKLSPQRLESWPSEAQLMRDIIVRTFGEVYKKAHGGKSIEDALILEDRSTNTLENFANTVNLNPEVLGQNNTRGLAADFHVPRTERIAYLFTGNSDIKSDSVQGLLQNRFDQRNKKREGVLVGRKDQLVVLKPVGNKEIYAKILNWMINPKNTDANARIANEKVFDSALQDPELLTYWLGYVGIVEDPRVLQKTIQRLSSDPAFVPHAVQAFSLAGLDFAELAKIDMNSLLQSQFKEIANKLKILTAREFRAMPVMPRA